MNNDALQAAPSLIIVQCTPATKTAAIENFIRKLYSDTTVIGTKANVECRNAVDEHTPDLIILYNESPDYQLEQLVQDIRQEHETPIAIIAPFTGTVANAINEGADTFIKLPCSQKEIQACVQSLWRRTQKKALGENSALQSGDLFLDPSGSGEAFLAGKRIKLQHLNFKILYALVCKCGTFIAYDVLCREAWSNNEYTFESLRVRIREIRRELEDDAKNPRWIESSRQFGYRFIGPTPTPVKIRRGEAQRITPTLPQEILGTDDRLITMQQALRIFNDLKLTTLRGWLYGRTNRLKKYGKLASNGSPLLSQREIAFRIEVSRKYWANRKKPKRRQKGT